MPQHDIAYHIIDLIYTPYHDIKKLCQRHFKVNHIIPYKSEDKREKTVKKNSLTGPLGIFLVSGITFSIYQPVDKY